MKVYIYLFSLFFALNVYSQVQPKLNLSHLPKEEKLSYTIFYNWGVIWKKAGRGDFILHHANYKGNKCYEIDLYGRTLSWAESFFKVRDTLRAYCLEDGFIPQYYTKRVHEGKFDAVNEAFYSYSKNEIIIDLKNTRKDTLHHKGTLKSTLATYDMLSVFYFLRSIDLRKASKGDEFPVEVIGEKSIFHLKFRFLGKEVVKIKGIETQSAFRLRLIFIDPEGNVDDDTMIVTIADDSVYTPLELEAKLKVGYLRAIVNMEQEKKTTPSLK